MAYAGAEVWRRDPSTHRRSKDSAGSRPSSRTAVRSSSSTRTRDVPPAKTWAAQAYYTVIDRDMAIRTDLDGKCTTVAVPKKCGAQSGCRYRGGSQDPTERAVFAALQKVSREAPALQA